MPKLDKNKFVMHLQSDGLDMFKEEKLLQTDGSNINTGRSGSKKVPKIENDYISK